MIVVGSKVYASGTDVYALAGPAVRDLDGNILVLTARELLSLEHTLQMHVGPEAASVGHRPSGYFHSEDAESSPSRLVGWFSPSAKLSSTGLPDKIANSSAVHLLEEIRIPSLQPDPVGYICGIDCFARFKDASTGAASVIAGLFRATGWRDGKHLGALGVAGAVVLSGDGSAVVGLVVGSLEGDVLIAPLDKTLAAEALELASPADIETHNREMDEAAARIKQQPPAAISKIIESFGSGDIPETIRSAIEMWAINGWEQYCENQQTAFAPFQEFFRMEPGDREEFVLRLFDFGLEYIGDQKIDGFGWDDIVLRIHALLVGDYASPPSQKKPVGTGPSSVETVAGIGNQARAA